MTHETLGPMRCRVWESRGWDKVAWVELRWDDMTEDCSVTLPSCPIIHWHVDIDSCGLETAVNVWPRINSWNHLPITSMCHRFDAIWSHHPCSPIESTGLSRITSRRSKEEVQSVSDRHHYRSDMSRISISYPQRSEVPYPSLSSLQMEESRLAMMNCSLGVQWLHDNFPNYPTRYLAWYFNT